MKRYLIVLMLSMFAVACGDDSDDGDDDDKSTDASTADDDAGGAFGTVDCDPLGSGACQNADDCPIVEGGSARAAASACGRSCLTGDAEAQATCARACVVRETELSAECAECYVGIVACSRDNCFLPCVDDPDSKTCFDCQVEKNCRAPFDACSGLPPVEMP